jgi:hypothetical protein
MRRMLIAAAAGLAILAAAAEARAEAGLVYFLAPESAKLFEGASEKADFWPLVARFVSEDRQTFCGIASSVMVLNALEIPSPPAPQWYPSEYWNESNIFTLPALKAVKSVQRIEAEGITLAELATLLSTSGAKAEATFASETSLDAFRAAARAALADPNAFLVVNVGRAELGQGGVEGGGHISPIAAYNADEDRFLMLDVARYKYLPSWIPAAQLYAAMNTLDTSSGKSRGYVVARR